jgi:hypothetical protein
MQLCIVNKLLQFLSRTAIVTFIVSQPGGIPLLKYEKHCNSKNQIVNKFSHSLCTIIITGLRFMCAKEYNNTRPLSNFHFEMLL